MAVYGNATTDLCYLIYSSTTKQLREDQMESFLQTYFQTFRDTVLSLDVRLNVTLHDLKKDFYTVSDKLTTDPLFFFITKKREKSEINLL